MTLSTNQVCKKDSASYQAFYLKFAMATNHKKLPID